MLVRRLPLGLVLATLLALAGCGGGSSGGGGASGPDPASLAPANAAVYGEALVRPEGDLEDGVRRAIQRVALVDDPGAEIARLIDSAAEDPDESYARDIEPWLGDRVGGFLLLTGSGDPEGAGIFVVRDLDALERTIARWRKAGDRRPAGTYRGVAYDRDVDDDSYGAIVGDFFVMGTLPGLKAAIDASEGDALADGDRYRDAIEVLDEDRLATVYADPRAVRDGLRDADVPPQVRQLLSSSFFDGDPATLTLTARAEEIALELSVDLGAEPPEASDEAAVSLGDLPDDAWLALATPPLGPLLRTALDSAGARDEAAGQLRAAGLDLALLERLGGLAAFVRGANPLDLGGGLLLRTSDEQAAATLMTRLHGLVNVATGGAARSFGGGFEVLVPGAPQPILVLAKGDRIAAGYGGQSARDLLEPRSRFDESPEGRAAIESLGDGFTPSFVLIAPPLVRLLESLDQLEVADLSPVLPYLRGYRSLAIGSKRDGARQTVRIVAALRDPA